MLKKHKTWFEPLFDFDESEPPPQKLKSDVNKQGTSSPAKFSKSNTIKPMIFNIIDQNHIRNFDPVNINDLAIHNKKVQEVEDWILGNIKKNTSEMLLLTGPVGCGKSVTVLTIAKKHNVKITEWITPIDIEFPNDNGEFEFKVKQSTQFLDFILNAANFTSLLDNNDRKLVLVEDFPNTFMRTPSELVYVLQQYKQRAKSPIVFICSESSTDKKTTSGNLFSDQLKNQLNIHHISFNGVSTTGLRSALKRMAEIISKKYKSMYNAPTSDLIECVVNSSAGDVRSAVTNLHFACLKGTDQSLETSIITEKDQKTKTKKKKPNSKFTSIGKDQSINILHGVGRVLNPRVVDVNGRSQFTHSPREIVEQFISQPSSFVNFIEENYMPHFSNSAQIDRAASTLSDAVFMLAEWREKVCQEYGLYCAVAGLMLANKDPVSAWNPVRGPKNMKITYPVPSELQLLEENYLYKGKTLVSDYQTFCKIINSNYD
ncbi:cell cycle checkpoint protein RAD17 isoform X2 [Bombyx mandarina]|uniref:Cell cycle checkpoint protein RAD17 isoform X2 n=1 Tax=Bombyx mandarina TaxID=7092 RepID=A0A6J2KNG8_BOMMA|nr:cell cycle checkpoint protein RAD17 isoform X2 [Bombyx mandarina]